MLSAYDKHRRGLPASASLPLDHISPGTSPRDSVSDSQNSESGFRFPDGESDSKRAKIIRPPSPIACNDDRNVGEFFDQFISKMAAIGLANNPAKITPCFILVCHMTPTIFPFLEAIKKIGEIVLIVPKGYVRENAKKIMSQLQTSDIIDANVLLTPKTDDSNEIKKIIKEFGLRLIKERVKDHKFLIIDIGGYFSEIFETLVLSDAETQLQNNLLGIVEDTENGHIAYEASIKKIQNCFAEENVEPSIRQQACMDKLYSMARSGLKNSEDFNVGKSIVEATDNIMRTVCPNGMLERIKKAGIIGFGKVGKSIANHLQKKGMQHIKVFDIDPEKLMTASVASYDVVTKENLLMDSDIIFSATGSQSLKAEDILFLNKNVFIASVTSREVEFHCSFLQALGYAPNLQSGDITKYSIMGKGINLLDDGNAVNFVYGAVNGPYIYAVQAGLIASAYVLIREYLDGAEPTPLSKFVIKEIPKNIRTIIAETWLKTFDQCNDSMEIHSSNFFLNDMKFTKFEDIVYIMQCLEKSDRFNCEEKNIQKSFRSIAKNVNEIAAAFKATIPDPQAIISHVEDIIASIKYFLDKAMFANLAVCVADFFINQRGSYAKSTQDREITLIKLYLLKTTGALYLLTGSNNFSIKAEKESADLLVQLYEQMQLCRNDIDLSTAMKQNRQTRECFKTFLYTVQCFRNLGTKVNINHDKLKEIISMASICYKEFDPVKKTSSLLSLPIAPPSIQSNPASPPSSLSPQTPGMFVGEVARILVSPQLDLSPEQHVSNPAREVPNRYFSSINL